MDVKITLSPLFSHYSPLFSHYSPIIPHYSPLLSHHSPLFPIILPLFPIISHHSPLFPIIPHLTMHAQRFPTVALWNNGNFTGQIQTAITFQNFGKVFWVLVSGKAWRLVVRQRSVENTLGHFLPFYLLVEVQLL